MNVLASKRHNPLKRSSRKQLRSGLSLLELLVVLTILIALGGIVVSTLPGMLQRTQVATAAANVPEIDAAIRRNAMLSQGQIGDRFDSLIAGQGSLDGEVVAYLGGVESLQPSSLSGLEVAALAEIGITELVPAATEPLNATFDSHDQLPVPLADDAKVCAVSADVAVELLRTNWNFEPADQAKYIAVGLGEQCSLVGAGERAAFSESPVHFSDDRNHSPESMYSRYMLLLELKPVNETRFVARYVGAAIPGVDGIHSLSKELESYYSN